MSILGAGTPTLDTGTLDTSTPDADFSHFQLILADLISALGDSWNPTLDLVTLDPVPQNPDFS